MTLHIIPLLVEGFCGTPGGTRTPGLLIRRSPSAVHSRPQASTQPQTKGFRFHRRPLVSTAVHSEWLPTWLPSRESRSRHFPTIRLVSSGSEAVCRETHGDGGSATRRVCSGKMPGWPTEELR